jgi:hypothetical protein
VGVRGAVAVGHPPRGPVGWARACPPPYRRTAAVAICGDRHARPIAGGEGEPAERGTGSVRIPYQRFILSSAADWDRATKPLIAFPCQSSPHQLAPSGASRCRPFTPDGARIVAAALAQEAKAANTRRAYAATDTTGKAFAPAVASPLLVVGLARRRSEGGGLAPGTWAHHLNFVTGRHSAAQRPRLAGEVLVGRLDGVADAASALRQAATDNGAEKRSSPVRGPHGEALPRLTQQRHQANPPALPQNRAAER